MYTSTYIFIYIYIYIYIMYVAIYTATSLCIYLYIYIYIYIYRERAKYIHIHICWLSCNFNSSYKYHINAVKYNFNMYPKYTSEAEATTRLSVIQQQVDKDYQTHKKFTGK